MAEESRMPQLTAQGDMRAQLAFALWQCQRWQPWRIIAQLLRPEALAFSEARACSNQPLPTAAPCFPIGLLAAQP